MADEVLLKIAEKIKKTPWDVGLYEDYYAVGFYCPLELKWLCGQCEREVPKLIDSKFDDALRMMEVHKKSLRALAPVDFDSYCQYIEWNREPSKSFYRPRRKALLPIVEAFQRVGDGKLKLLTISLPPGTGKSTLSLFFMTWMAGRHPELPMLTGSHSNSFIRGVYDEALRIMDPVGEYLWHEVFPQVPVSNTNAKDCRIDLGKRKRFDTFQFTTIGSGNAGLYRAQGLLFCDDLVSGIEVALSKERLDKLWETYTTDLRQRKQGDCPEVHVATRWSVHDVLGRLEERYGGQEDAAFLRFPAMNEKDESNFDYPYGVGFSTEFYRGQREIMDDASWRALYMNEPIEREGQLYDGDLLRRYFELPMGEPDAIIAVCDTKDKGSDYAVLPVVYVYGQDYYLEECLCDDGLPETVDVRMVDILYRHKVQMCRFESNSAGGRIAEKVQNEVKKRGGITHITTKFTSANKETKIIVNSAWVKEHVLFKDSTTYKRGSEYGKMMEWLTAYTVAGKNRHDDVPDAMAMLAEYAQTFTAVKFQVMARPF